MRNDSLGNYSLALLAAFVAAASLGCACDPCGGGLCSGRHGGCDSCGGDSCGGCDSCGGGHSCSLFGCWPCGRNWCGDVGCGSCCESTDGCGRNHCRDFERRFTCGSGCGDMYWGEAHAERCDSCDCDGHFTGLDCCLRDGWSWFWGYGCGRCSPCGCDGGSCGGGCNSCGAQSYGGSHGSGCASCGHGGNGGYEPAQTYLNGGSGRVNSPRPAAPRMQEMEVPPPPPPPTPDMNARTRRGPSYGKVGSGQVHVAQPGRKASQFGTVSYTAPQQPAKSAAATRSAMQASFSKPQPAATTSPRSGNASGRVVRFQTTAPGGSDPLNYEIELRDGETLAEPPVLSAAK